MGGLRGREKRKVKKNERGKEGGDKWEGREMKERERKKERGRKRER